MSKSKYKSLIVLLFIFAALCTFLLAANSVNQGLATNNQIKSAPRPSSQFLDDYYNNCSGIISPLGIGEWEVFTPFQNYSVNKDIEDNSIIYFGRDVNDERHFSNATLTTPYLTLNESHAIYTLSFEYFSPRTINLANNIKVYSSRDGNRYEKIGEVEKAYNSNENSYISVNFDVKSDVKYLRFDLKIFNSVDNENSRIYLKNFDITPQNPIGDATPIFNVEIFNSNLEYTGHRQVPLYTVECESQGYIFATKEIVLNTSNKMVESIDIGTYKLIVLIYNDDNILSHIEEASFEIVEDGMERYTYTYVGIAQELTLNNPTGNEEIKYYKDNLELSSAPKDAGQYIAKVYEEDSLIKTVSMIIKPMEITHISSSKFFTRLYDGTTNVYDANKEDFIFSSSAGIIEDTTLSIDNLKLNFACNMGKSYLVFDNSNLGNFVVNKGKVETATLPEIKKIDIKIATNIDENNDKVITILDKFYDGQNNANIDTNSIVSRYSSIKNAPIEFLGVPKDDSFYIDGLSASFESVFASNDINVSLKITDQTYLDRFNEEIYTKGLITGNILPKKVSILPTSDIEVVTKSYDATLKAQVIINSVEFGTDIILADQAIMANNDNFEISYSIAEYVNANAGIKQVNIKGLVLHSKNPIYTKVINSYEVYDTNCIGEITPMAITVKDEYFNIIAGQDLPTIQTSPKLVNVYTAYYYTQLEAENREVPIGSFNTNDYQGDYFVRVEIPFNEPNYEIVGDYKIIPIEITQSKKDQEITFGIEEFLYNNAEYGDYYKMAIGGRFTPNAVSKAEYDGNSYLTNLPITYERNTGTKMTFAQGVYTAREEGLVTITASSFGNLSYNAAQSVTIKILIVDCLITPSDDIVVDAPILYYGDKTPKVSGSALFLAEKVLGEFVNAGGTLLTGNASYSYDFIPSEKYLGEYKDVLVELSANKATLKLNISDITKDYYSDIDFLNFSKITLVKGDNERILKQTDFANLNLSFKFSSDIKKLLYKETAYQVGFNDTFEYYLEVLENPDYNIVFENESFNLLVNRREVYVEIIDFAKEYGYSNYQVFFTLKGCDSEDSDLIRQKTNVIEQAKLDSDVGRYVLLLSIEEDASLANKYYIKTIYGYMDVIKANVVFRADNLSSVYEQDILSATFTVSGFHIESDKEYYSRFVELAHTVTTNDENKVISNTDTYPISIICTQSNDNYNFSFVNGSYTVSPATLSGIILSDSNFLYDGKKHSISVVYDKDVWGELDIVYNNYDIVAIGKYPITAVVSKENYHNLVLNATLTISSLTMSTSNKQTVATITMLGEDAKGFDPQSTLMLVQNTNKEILDNYSKLLKTNEETVENILGVYNYFLTVDGARKEIEGNCQIKIKLEGVGSTSKVRVLAKVGGELKEVIHTYQSGYIVFESGGANEFAVIKQVSAYSKDTSSLIIAISIGIIVLVVFFIAFFGYKGRSKRARKRSIRKHKRWA